MSSVWVIIVSLLFTFQDVASKDRLDINKWSDIGFPESFGDESMRPADNRDPLYVPSRCGENEILYPGDHIGDWTCDCRPAYIYHPEEDKCFPSHEQGPCSVGEYLILIPGREIPVCVRNPCFRAKQVQLSRKRKCVSLGKPCNANTRRVYGVNATTFTVECLDVPNNRLKILNNTYRLYDNAQSKTRTFGLSRNRRSSSLENNVIT